MSAQQLLFEDFSTATGATPPTGWTQNTIIGDPAVDTWRFDNPGGQGLFAPITSPAAVFDSDDYSDNSLAEDVALESPSFDASAVSGPITLSFDHYFEDGAGGAYAVEVFNGTSWTSVLSGTVATANPQAEAIDITTAAGGSAVAQVRFRWTGDWSFWWIVDNIDVTAASAADVGISFIELPEADCDLSPDSIRIGVENFGTSNQTAIPWTIVINRDGNLVTTLTCTTCPDVDAGLVDTIAVGGVASFFAVDGNYEVVAYTNLTGDGNLANDTIVGFTENITPLSLPYSEDFDGFSAGFGPFPDGWTNQTNDDRDWTLTSGPTGSSGTGPDGDNTTGSGNYFYTEASFISTGDVFSLLSPCIDLGGATNPALSYFYHMFDDATGEMGRLDVFVNVGGVSTHVDSIIGAQQSNQADPYLESVIDLNAFIGSVIRLEFKGTRGTDFRSDIAIDDVSVFDIQPIDLELNTLVSPVQAFACFGNDELLSVSFENAGSDTLGLLVDADTAFISLTVSGANTGSYADTVILDSLLPGDMLMADISGVDLSVAGNSDLTFVIAITGDGNAANDTLRATLLTQPTITSYPYFEDFESGQGGWVAEGATSTWAFGTPAKDVITGAASGSNAWVTGGLGTDNYNVGESSSVLSPCFDMTNAPFGVYAAMKIWYEVEDGFDGAVLQTSIDSGATWQNVGAFGDPNNWFNDDGINGNPGGQPEGWTGDDLDGSGGYLQAFHELDSSLIGQPDVRFRVAFGSDGSVQMDGFAFDDFGVGFPAFAALPDTATYCNGDSIDSQSPNVTYLWSNGATTQSIAATNSTGSNIVDSTISVVITTDIGIVVNDTVVATILASASPSVTGLKIEDVACFGDSTGSIDLTLAGDATPFTFVWDNGDTTEDLTNLPAGDYVGVVTDTNGCVFTSPVLTVAQPDTSLSVVLDSIVDVVCPADTGSINITVSGGTVPYSFSWDNGDSTQNIAVTAGDYIGTITDANGCVLVSPTLTVSASDSLPGAPIINQATVGERVDFTGDATNADSYSWTFGDGGTSTDQNPSHIYSANGMYTVILTVTNQCGTSTDSVEVNMTTVGIEDELNRAISVFPNPNTGKFELKLEDFNANELSIKVVTLEGQLVLASEFGAVSAPYIRKIELPSGIARGVYILQVNVDERVVFKRLSIE
ncbi:MAG: PKD domain-containing protein [Bacteroidota bacterium]